MSEFYTHDFYKFIGTSAESSARVMAPMILEKFQARSIVDIGSGNGVWLSVFEELGVKDVLGMDGDYVLEADLKIAPEKFKPVDLSSLTKPPAIGRKFDLAISLEVGEHLPKETAPRFVDFITSLAPAVVFSAAIPGQGGQNHINEQWPSFWIELFAAKGFGVSDPFRSRVWSNSKVAFWYAQNTLVFEKTASPVKVADPNAFSLVHPSLYLREHEKVLDLQHRIDPKNMPFVETATALPQILVSAAKRRLQKSRKAAKAKPAKS